MYLLWRGLLFLYSGMSLQKEEAERWGVCVREEVCVRERLGLIARTCCFWSIWKTQKVTGCRWIINNQQDVMSSLRNWFLLHAGWVLIAGIVLREKQYHCFSLSETHILRKMHFFLLMFSNFDKVKKTRLKNCIIVWFLHFLFLHVSQSEHPTIPCLSVHLLVWQPFVLLQQLLLNFDPHCRV